MLDDFVLKILVLKLLVLNLVLCILRTETLPVKEERI